MATKWFHKVSLDWLKARQGHITATDVRKLLPVTKTGRKRTVSDIDKWSILASKKVNLTEDDCQSTGAAARGHVLEPYALEFFNEKVGEACGEILHHWDDVLLVKDTVMGTLAFSPDATDQEQPEYPGISKLHVPNIRYIGEVKCYGADRHYACGHTPKEELEERWQVAAAMAVYESIDHAWLIFFNPSLEDQMYVVRYSRAELANEIAICLDVEQDWLDFLINRCNHYTNDLYHGDECREGEIIADIIDSERLNPDGEKSVIV